MFIIDYHLHPVYTIKLAQRVGYMLAGRTRSMFARCLLDVCSTFARCPLDVSSTFAWCVLDVCYALCMLHICSMFARCLLAVCSIV